MRPAYLALSAVGITPWIPVDRLQETIAIGVAVTLSEDANLTYTVHHTFDPLASDYALPITIARAGTVATVTFPYQHGLVTGDSLIVTGSGSSVLDSQPFPQQIGPPFASNINQPVPWAVASTPSPTTLTYTCANSGSTASAGPTMALIQRVFPNATLAAQTAKGFAAYTLPISAVRLNITVYTAGFAQIGVLQGGH